MSIPPKKYARRSSSSGCNFAGQEKKSEQHDFFIFFHPDCTVGPGIAPGHALRLADSSNTLRIAYTAGRELHPALKMVLL